MSKEIVGILLLALAGFLAGGVYSTYKTAKVMAGVLLVATLLALGGGILWFVS
ncbi:hypothetical protein LWP59_30535 [Amycolatopsis acidiphila]|uniref:hypothetical protein n=1 Tax=Amycolatopsis acidiphila TaxID=715473 RepID=UPI0016439361|nr:hypothetical protein [Amycolatopsis acidiphila]UIJ58419.1 hypothetical protein LWP59_30535 [Amycolatopsis acidiphila]GHG93379.1 hypothetical protein GCM10017788_70700 [Amycolatopsis acidiphila]